MDKKNYERKNSRATGKVVLLVIAALTLLAAYSLFLPATGAYFTSTVEVEETYEVVFNSNSNLRNN